MDNSNSRDIIRAANIKKTAEIVGVSPRFVNYVLNGDRESEDVLSVFMLLQEGENKLLQAVKELLPFDQPHKSATQGTTSKKPTARTQNSSTAN